MVLQPYLGRSSHFWLVGVWASGKRGWDPSVGLNVQLRDTLKMPTTLPTHISPSYTGCLYTS